MQGNMRWNSTFKIVKHQFRQPFASFGTITAAGGRVCLVYAMKMWRRTKVDPPPQC